MKNKVIACYVAAPYTAVTVDRQELNVQAAKCVGTLVMEAGAFPLLPTVNTGLFDTLTDSADWQTMIDGTNDQLERCDVAFFMHGWHKSKGCTLEMATCKKLGIPAFTDLEEFEQWVVDKKTNRIS